MEREAGAAKGPPLISVPRGKRVERGKARRGRAGERRTIARKGGGRGDGERVGRGSDLHKYIEFIEMSLGIAARRILAAYQPPRRFIPSAVPPSSPRLAQLPPPSSSLAFIKIAGLIYAAR